MDVLLMVHVFHTALGRARMEDEARFVVSTGTELVIVIYRTTSVDMTTRRDCDWTEYETRIVLDLHFIR